MSENLPAVLRLVGVGEADIGGARFEFDTAHGVGVGEVAGALLFLLIL